MKKLIALLCIVFIVQGCGLFSRETGLEAPSNLRKEGEMVVWDDVEGAQAYQVLRGGSSVQVATSELSVFDLPNGQYEIEVRAIKGDQRSEWTTFSFTIARTLDHPTNLRVQNDTLLWDSPSGYSVFKVMINDDAIEVNEAQFDLSSLEENQLFEIVVKTSHANQLSEASRTVYYHTYKEVKATLEVTYNQAMLRNVSVSLEDIESIEAVLINYQAIDATFSQQILTLPFSELFNLDRSIMHTIDVITEEGRVEIRLEIEYLERPYLRSPRTQMYDRNTDIVYEFELFSGSFNGLSGQDITQSDYTFIEGTLTIKAQFIESLLVANPERSRVIFSYVLETEEGDIFIGYLFIDMP